MNVPSLVLASASPARRRLLETAGIHPIICKSDFDESLIENPEPIELVKQLAKCKAEVVAQKFQDSLILGCDSLLLMNGKTYGKPDSPAEAVRRWQEMRGKKGLLHTGHALLDQRQDQWIIRCGITTVYFANVDDETITAYVDSGEPLKCAGCFAIEGKGGLLIERIEGCHTNVIGLSLPLFREMLEQLGYQPRDFWSSQL
jgi:septum formation protein